jgi:hypothetical protein
LQRRQRAAVLLAGTPLEIVLAYGHSDIALADCSARDLREPRRRYEQADTIPAAHAAQLLGVADLRGRLASELLY